MLLLSSPHQNSSCEANKLNTEVLTEQHQSQAVLGFRRNNLIFAFLPTINRGCETLSCTVHSHLLRSTAVLFFPIKTKQKKEELPSAFSHRCSRFKWPPHARPLLGGGSSKNRRLHQNLQTPSSSAAARQLRQTKHTCACFQFCPPQPDARQPSTGQVKRRLKEIQSAYLIKAGGGWGRIENGNESTDDKRWWR